MASSVRRENWSRYGYVNVMRDGSGRLKSWSIWSRKFPVESFKIRQKKRSDEAAKEEGRAVSTRTRIRYSIFLTKKDWDSPDPQSWWLRNDSKAWDGVIGFRAAINRSLLRKHQRQAKIKLESGEFSVNEERTNGQHTIWYKALGSAYTDEEREFNPLEV